MSTKGKGSERGLHSEGITCTCHAKALWSCCRSADPSERPTFAEALKKLRGLVTELSVGSALVTLQDEA